jgi:hypothetical protein
MWAEPLYRGEASTVANIVEQHKREHNVVSFASTIHILACCDRILSSLSTLRVQSHCRVLTSRSFTIEHGSNNYLFTRQP